MIDPATIYGRSDGLDAKAVAAWLGQASARLAVDEDGSDS